METFLTFLHQVWCCWLCWTSYVCCQCRRGILSVSNCLIQFSRLLPAWSEFQRRLWSRDDKQELRLTASLLSDPQSAQRSHPPAATLLSYLVELCTAGSTGVVPGLLHHPCQGDPLLPHSVPPLGVLEEATGHSHGPGTRHELPPSQIKSVGSSQALASLLVWCCCWRVFCCSDHTSGCG